ncbi:hypothetical protein CNYM01_05784 [Colletotrichum nymphaeae SA-01]|uniref:Uncharacterized protein n=1 Tax=Colletotrichum nymphaeae SA-01 TaxID=1460502 RepID=A0A135S5H7_9PEZI|nr:hypothetical protein CNYM01_05784 [Colletotrichum nymphaeae SA-01]
MDHGPKNGAGEKTTHAPWTGGGAESGTRKQPTGPVLLVRCRRVRDLETSRQAPPMGDIRVGLIDALIGPRFALLRDPYCSVSAWFSKKRTCREQKKGHPDGMGWERKTDTPEKKAAAATHRHSRAVHGASLTDTYPSFGLFPPIPFAAAAPAAFLHDFPSLLLGT